MMHFEATLEGLRKPDCILVYNIGSYVQAFVKSSTRNPLIHLELWKIVNPVTAGSFTSIVRHASGKEKGNVSAVFSS